MIQKDIPKIFSSEQKKKIYDMTFYLKTYTYRS